MTVTLPQTAIEQTQRVVLEGISWETYQTLLREAGDQRATRFAYDRGVLEITMPSFWHEFLNRILEAMIRALAEESNLRIRGCGSTTIDREDLECGVEPDSCFYLGNVDRILGRRKIDFQTDPPPDLALEVDITSSSRRRFGIYLQLQIPELWRYTEAKGVMLYKLQDNEYVECEFSPRFPMISGAVLMQFLQLSETEDDIAVVRALREWLRQAR